MQQGSGQRRPTDLLESGDLRNVNHASAERGGAPRPRLYNSTNSSFDEFSGVPGGLVRPCTPRAEKEITLKLENAGSTKTHMSPIGARENNPPEKLQALLRRLRVSRARFVHRKV